MKIKFIIIGFIAILLISGCNSKSKEENTTFNKAISEGKLAIANKEYEKAEGMFELAKSENQNDKEAQNLYEQTVIILEIQELLENGMIDEANIKLEELNKIDSDIDIIKKDAKELIENFDNSDIINIETNSDTNIVSNTITKPKGNLVLDYVVNQSEEEFNGITYRDGEGKIELKESDYSLYTPFDEEERLVSTYVPQTYVYFSLNNIGEETITNPIINFKFNDMAIQFTPNEVWKGIGHIRGLGTWNEVRWTPEPGTTIQPSIPMAFTFSFQDASIYSDNASIDVTLSGDNFNAKTFNIPVQLIN